MHSSETETLKKAKTAMIKERLRSMQRIWAAMTKFVASQCDSGRTVDLPLAGKFKRLKSAEDGEDAEAIYSFMPHLDFVGSGHFKFSENAKNVSPLSKGAVGFQSNLITVSLTSTGAVCNLDRESVAMTLKAIFSNFVSLHLPLNDPLFLTVDQCRPCW